MSDKNDSKTSGEHFHILPIKPKEPPQSGAELNSNPNLPAFVSPGPVLPGNEALANAGPPASSEELAVRTAELNQ